MTYGTVNVDTVTTSTSGGVLGAGNASIMKNRIINGGMKIAQRGTSSITANNSGAQFPVDRFFVYCDPSSKFTAQQTTADPSTAGGQTNCLAITSSSAFTVTSGTIAVLEQRIEGYNVSDLQYGYSTAKTVTLSFWVYCSLTGTFGGSIIAGSGTRAYPFTYTVTTANTWQQISITITGDTTTQNNITNGTGLIVSWSMGTGSTYNGTANTWQDGELYGATGAQNLIATNGATFYITGVQLEVGSSATGFEYVNYQTSLANCQRYFWRKSGVASAVVTVGSGMAYNTTDIRCTLPNPVTMRSTPTISFTGSNFEYEKTASSRGTLGSVDATARSVDASTLFSGSGTTSTTAGQGGIWYITDSASYISISAEL